MDPIENLSRDHGHITLALDAMDALNAAAALGEFALNRYEQVVDFVEIWADGAHYEKEEHLFAALASNGIPRDNGPTAFLEMEHRATLDQTERMREAILRIRAGSKHEAATVIDAVARYSAIIRMHMPKEDFGYFPMAAKMLSPAALEELGQIFDGIDAKLPATFAEAVQALLPAASPAEGVAGVGTEEPVIPLWHNAEDRQVRQILRSMDLSPGAASLPVTRRRSPS